MTAEGFELFSCLAARAQARTTGKDEDKAIRHLFQRLEVLLVKGNAALLVNRIPSHPLASVNDEL